MNHCDYCGDSFYDEPFECDEGIFCCAVCYEEHTYLTN